VTMFKQLAKRLRVYEMQSFILRGSSLVCRMEMECGSPKSK